MYETWVRVVRRLRPTINSRTAAHSPTALYDRSTSVEVHARLANLGGEGGGVRRNVLDISAGLYMVREVARVLATLDNEDLESGVCGSQTPCDDTSSCSAWRWVSKAQVNASAKYK